jgi:predicted methyltransferase
VKPWCGLELTTKYLKILDTIRELYREVIPQNRYDQAPLVPVAAVYKVAHAIQRGDVANKDVVYARDDDFYTQKSVVRVESGKAQDNGKDEAPL